MFIQIFSFTAVSGSLSVFCHICLINVSSGVYYYYYYSLSLSLLALQPPSGVVFYSPLAGFSLLVYEVSLSHTTTRHSR